MTDPTVLGTRSADNRSHIERINGAPAHEEIYDMLDPKQFEELKEMLRPGMELSIMILADYKAKAQAQAEFEAAEAERIAKASQAAEDEDQTEKA